MGDAVVALVLAVAAVETVECTVAAGVMLPVMAKTLPRQPRLAKRHIYFPFYYYDMQANMLVDCYYGCSSRLG